MGELRAACLPSEPGAVAVLLLVVESAAVLPEAKGVVVILVS